MTDRPALAQAIAADYNEDPEDGRHVLVVVRSVTIAEVLLNGESDPHLLIRSTGDPTTWQLAGLLRAGQVDMDAQLARSLGRGDD